MNEDEWLASCGMCDEEGVAPVHYLLPERENPEKENKTRRPTGMNFTKIRRQAAWR